MLRQGRLREETITNRKKKLVKHWRGLKGLYRGHARPGFKNTRKEVICGIQEISWVRKNTGGSTYKKGRAA